MRVHGIWVEKIRAVLTAANLAGGNVEQERAEPTTDDILPIALIAFEKDSGKSDGDPRTCQPGFVHEATVQVIHFDSANTGPGLRAKLYAAGDLITATLLGNVAAWQGEDDDGLPYLEGIAGIDVAYQLPPEGAEIMGSVVVNLRLLHRTTWPQNAGAVLPDFRGLGVTVPLVSGEDEPQPGISIEVPE